MKRNILELMEETAARVPERRAFYDDREALSFAALTELARRIGSGLAAVTRPRQVVALLLDARSIRNLPAIFGVLYAGCAYAPLDITMPAQRLEQLLRLMQPAAILTDDKGGRALTALPGDGSPRADGRRGVGNARECTKAAGDTRPEQCV